MSSMQSYDRHPVCMINSSEDGGQRFYSVSYPKQILVFFCSHEPLLFRTLMCLYGHRYGTDTLMDFCFTTLFIWAVLTLFPFKRYM